MQNSSKAFVTMKDMQDQDSRIRLCEKSHKLQLMNTDTQLYLPRSDPDDCECDVHGIEIRKARYKQLVNKERRLRNELTKVNREMIDLTSLMLDSACNVDETIKSVYKMDYEKRGLPVIRYRPLMVMVDSPIQSPIMPAIIGLKDVYKDPIRFKYSAMERPTIQPAKTIALLKETGSFWDEPFTSCSEYMDTISKMGISNMKNQQQYLRPFVPSRNFGDCNLSKSI